MNLDELELYKAESLQEGVCDLRSKDVKKEEEEEFEDNAPSVNEKLLEDCVKKIMRFLFGKEWEGSVKEKSRKKVREIIHETLQMDVIEQTENDLGDTLDLLEDSLFLLERILARHSHTALNVEMVDHMETVAEHLEQWGMGDSKQAEKRRLVRD